ncbi:MAG: hypothetical protein C0599_13545 [Salinivirgaceae bacterium]|nr:MAG: hypothetical protein C0599_13545 [Salinivirgaceae bacterium]
MEINKNEINLAIFCSFFMEANFDVKGNTINYYFELKSGKNRNFLSYCIRYVRKALNSVAWQTKTLKFVC